MAVTARVADRITTQLKRYQGILAQAQQRDVGESDTALIISDMLSDVFGYSKYEHITTEHAALRKELRRLSPGLRVEVDRLKATLADHVIKRDLIDSEEGQAAQTAMKKLARALERERDKKAAAASPVATEQSIIEALPVDPTPAR